VTSPAELARLQEAFASAGVRENDPEIDTEEIFRAVRGELDPERRLAIIDQVALNPRAAEAWRLAEELLADQKPRAQRTPLRHRTRRMRLLGMVATVGVASAAGLVMYLPGSAPRNDAAVAPLTRSIEDPGIAIEARPRVCTRERCELAWTGAPGQDFTLRVTTETLETLQEVELRDATTFELPAADLARVPPGGVLLWQVTARNADGQETRSITFRQAIP
jgi:hypothetical protein